MHLRAQEIEYLDGMLLRLVILNQSRLVLDRLKGETIKHEGCFNYAIAPMPACRFEDTLVLI